MDLPLESLINLPGHCLCVWPVVLLLTFMACLCCAAAHVHVMSFLCCCSRPCHVFVVLLLTSMSCLCCAAAHVHVMSLLSCCSRPCHVFVVLLLTSMSCLCCAAAHVHVMSLLCILSIQLSPNSIAGNGMGKLNPGTFRYRNINEHDDTIVANKMCQYHTHHRAYFMMKFCGDFPVMSDFSVIYHNSLTYMEVFLSTSSC